MNYQDELLRRMLGVEMPIKVDLNLVPAPGLIHHVIHTDDPARSMVLKIETLRNRMTLMLQDWQGSYLWIRTFDFEGVER